MKKSLYFENFAVGDVLTSETYTVDKEHALAFAREYDPQAQHIDEVGAAGTLFGGLIVSGWQTAAISMRLVSILIQLCGPTQPRRFNLSSATAPAPLL